MTQIKPEDKNKMVIFTIHFAMVYYNGTYKNRIKSAQKSWPHFLGEFNTKQLVDKYYLSMKKKTPIRVGTYGCVVS
jgi:hypothetical protein